jgi:hypothetical protein
MKKVRVERKTMEGLEKEKSRELSAVRKIT